jgi:AraC-like DNA-binding protein
MLQAKLRKPPLWEYEIALAFQSLVMHLARALVEPSTNDGAVISSPQVITVQTVRLSVHQDLRRSWTIAAMARLAGVSPARFTAWYRAVFGATPIDDLIRARVERACWLLKTGEQSLAEISADCGFSDVYYFSRQFRKRIGITPGKYRMSARLR